jgi:HSP20 family molecular chaperone IbpA
MFKKGLGFAVLPFVLSVTLHAHSSSNNLFGHSLFDEMQRMQEEMDRLFSQMQHPKVVHPSLTWQNRATFESKGDHYRLNTGIKEHQDNEIKITLDQRLLSVRAKVVLEEENQSKQGSYQSRSISIYQQSFRLPKDAKEEGLKAHYEKGSLVITLPKAPSTAVEIPITPTNVKAPATPTEVKESNATGV